MRYIYRNITLLNLLLLASLVSLVLFVILPLFHPEAKYVVPFASKTPIVEEEVPSGKDQPPPLSDYMVIGENNLFHPQRMIPPEKKDAKAMPKPELVLYGTVMFDDISVAYVEDKKSPKTTPGRGKRQSVIKKGDTIGGFALTEIKADRIVLKRGEETMVVPLLEAGKQRGDDSKHGPARPSPASQASLAPPSSPVPVPAATAAVKPAAVSPAASLSSRPASAPPPPSLPAPGGQTSGGNSYAASSGSGPASPGLSPAAPPSADIGAAPTLQQLQRQRYRSNTARGAVRPVPLDGR